MPKSYACYEGVSQTVSRWSEALDVAVQGQNGSGADDVNFSV